MANDEQSLRGKLALQIVAMPKDTNANGDIFGGWLVSLMDMGTAIEARALARSRVVTAAIDELVFIRPVNVGDTVCVYVELLRVGRTSMRFQADVWTVSFVDDSRVKIAQGIFTFVAIDEDRKPHPVKR